MTEILNYASGGPRRYSRWLAYSSLATIFYPLLVTGALYGEWLLAGYVLGHSPRPSLDDPKFIPGSSWMHDLAFLALLGVCPVAGLAITLNIGHILFNRPSVGRSVARIAALAGLWLGLVGLLR